MGGGYHVAAIDFGKTNKKVLVYDRNLRLCASARKSFGEVRREGFRCDDIPGAMRFVAEELRKLARSGRYRIRAISVTAHGATLAMLKADGSLALPNISYDTDPGAETRKAFFERFGDPGKLQAETCTPPLPLLINPGIQIFWLQRQYPKRFRSVATIQFLPQYIGFLLTGRTAVEPTYCGCHTYLWDFDGNRFGRIARELGVADMFPGNMNNPWDVQGTLSPEWAKKTGLPCDCIVTCGIHDSNSSLLPYLVKDLGRFVLNSTGTWCVAMSPDGTYPLSADEIGKEVFYNLSAFGRPVKTTILRGGAEFDFYRERLCGGRPHPARPDAKALDRVVREGMAIVPALFRGTGVFPHGCPSIIGADALLTDANLAFHALDLSLAIQSKRGIRMACGGGEASVAIEGGFAGNATYCRLLAALMPDARVYISSLREATAYGAAMLGICAVEGKTPRDIAERVRIRLDPVEPLRTSGLEEYEKRFVELAGG
ncbi:MAG: FGGY family carbohydrate kinase [Planctomycetota bacterium]|nr:FGGY family carbohydrate kinase [Planctomycetota bacterium]